MLKTMDTKKLIGKSLQPARPARHLSSQHASTITFNFQAEFPCSTQVCLRSGVSWWYEATGMQTLNQTVIPSQPEWQESKTKKENPAIREFVTSCSGKIQPGRGEEHPPILYRMDTGDPVLAEWKINTDKINKMLFPRNK
ncbi:uncharacterized protein C8orf88 homolog isoform X1 [Caretta caretta]|uniref:uncharacterized protein C8orf88 homolog isoform X1 n=1 Tax=Caretta caretta TaxID=8467 RepID=UPI003F4B839A